MPSHWKGGWPELDSLHAGYPDVSATSLASTITILKPSEYSALAHLHHRCKDNNWWWWIPSIKHQTWRQNRPQLQNATQPLSHLLHKRSWPPLRLLGCHPHGIGIRQSTPTQSWCNDVLLWRRLLLQQFTRLPPRGSQGHGNNSHMPHPTPCRSWYLLPTHYQLSLGGGWQFTTRTRRPMWQSVPHPMLPTHTLQSSHQHLAHLAHQPRHSHTSPYFQQLWMPPTNSLATSTPFEWQTCLCTRACSLGQWVRQPTDAKPTKSHGSKHTYLQKEHNYLVPLSPTQPSAHQWYDRLWQQHPHCIWNVPSSLTNAILPDGLNDTTDTLYERYSHYGSLEGWRFQSHAHLSCRLRQTTTTTSHRPPNFSLSFLCVFCNFFTTAQKT